MASDSFATGIRVESSTDTVIGGNSPGARNVISGNDGGIALWGGTRIDVDPGDTGTVIQGNYIGVGSDGITAVPNTGTWGTSLSVTMLQIAQSAVQILVKATLSPTTSLL